MSDADLKQIFRFCQGARTNYLGNCREGSGAQDDLSDGKRQIEEVFGLVQRRTS